MTKSKFKKVAEKVTGIICIVLGMILGYQGVKMITKKEYARAYVDIPAENN